MLKAVPMSERPVGSRMDSVFESGCRDPLEEAQKPRANAAFVVLARNSELDGVLSSIRSLERHFNQWFNYPWIFLNDEVFTDEFKDEVKAATSGKVRFGTVPAVRWHVPAENDDPLFFSEAIEEQGDRGIMYGSMPAYHRMCRFYSGYFFDHYLVRKLDWYWRVEPDVDFFCDITYDPFKEMEAHNKKYGFTIMIKELINTVPNLFRTTVAYAKKNDIKLPDSWSLFSKDLEIARGTNDHLYRDVKDKDQFWKKLQGRVPLYRAMRWSDTNEDGIDSHSLKVLADYTNGGGLTNVPADRFDNLEYNLCHFWSNFEIGRTDLFQSKQYRDYFHFLEESNGFFVERWGDAPIHSLALGMFLNQSEIHYFRDIGYRHSTLEHCPANSINQRPYSEGPRYRHGYSKQEEDYWLKFDSPPSDKDIGTGCRCRCPDDHQEIENSGSSCVSLWAMMSDDERTPKKALDLDRIESEAVNLYEKYLSKHPENGEEWALSGDDIKRLEQFTV
ncbi:DEKNAAC100567 [Brettanomyces naardenensis]|uniref:DEKNAAC100567 n=1 Tax=Brettanomyces naardenensis TaxID=13370 RepID=A0A448YEP8_BRENA|nr:DEKNAAC100567 [Brettanomyces naardenensis]